MTQTEALNLVKQIIKNHYRYNEKDTQEMVDALDNVVEGDTFFRILEKYYTTQMPCNLDGEIYWVIGGNVGSGASLKEAMYNCIDERKKRNMSI